ncbi:unnamed protein product [Trichobilharzia regenti]|nr:unnamed protein product [Trichobilharzia regenti]
MMEQDHETPLNLTQPKLLPAEKDVNDASNSTSSVQQLYDTISNSLSPQNLTYQQSAKSITNTSLFPPPPPVNIPSVNPLIQMTQSMPWLQQKSDQLTNGLICPTNDTTEMMMMTIPSDRNLTPFFNWLSTFPDMSTNPMTHSPNNNNNSNNTNNAFTETMLNYMKCYYAKLSSNQIPSQQYQMEIGPDRKTSHASNKQHSVDNQQLSTKNSIGGNIHNGYDLIGDNSVPQKPHLPNAFIQLYDVINQIKPKLDKDCLTSVTSTSTPVTTLGSNIENFKSNNFLIQTPLVNNINNENSYNGVSLLTSSPNPSSSTSSASGMYPPKSQELSSICQPYNNPINFLSFNQRITSVTEMNKNHFNLSLQQISKFNGTNNFHSKGTNISSDNCKSENNNLDPATMMNGNISTTQSSINNNPLCRNDQCHSMFNGNNSNLSGFSLPDNINCNLPLFCNTNTITNANHNNNNGFNDNDTNSQSSDVNHSKIGAFNLNHSATELVKQHFTSLSKLTSGSLNLNMNIDDGNTNNNNRTAAVTTTPPGSTSDTIDTTNNTNVSNSSSSIINSNEIDNQMKDSVNSLKSLTPISNQNNLMSTELTGQYQLNRHHHQQTYYYPLSQHKQQQQTCRLMKRKDYNNNNIEQKYKNIKLTYSNNHENNNSEVDEADDEELEEGDFDIAQQSKFIHQEHQQVSHYFFPSRSQWLEISVALFDLTE